MIPNKAYSADHVINRGLFDPKWYSETYLDVSLTGFSPEYHYQTYGYPILSRPPNKIIAEDPVLNKAVGLCPPKAGKELVTAYEILVAGQPELALAYARLHLPEAHHHTAEIIRANVALSYGDQDDWLSGLNNYLMHFGMDPITLNAENSALLTRFNISNLKPIEGGPMVSVIMPAWNAEAWIEMAVRSILDQTWRNLELIVVDDASTDNTWTVLTNLAKGETRLRIRRNSINVGPYVSKNLGLDMAEGEWITGHDADDWAHPRRLELHISEVLAEPRPPEASLTFMIRMQPSGHFDTIVPVNAFSPDGVTRVSSISTLFSRALLRDHLGYWDTVRFGADSEMIARARKFLGNDLLQLSQIGMICLSTETALTNRPETGIRADFGRPVPDRIAYKNSWTSAHKALQIGNLFLPFPQTIRKYKGEFSHEVPLADVQAVRAARHLL